MEWSDSEIIDGLLKGQEREWNIFLASAVPRVRNKIAAKFPMGTPDASPTEIACSAGVALWKSITENPEGIPEWATQSGGQMCAWMCCIALKRALGRSRKEGRRAEIRGEIRGEISRKLPESIEDERRSAWIEEFLSEVEHLYDRCLAALEDDEARTIAEQFLMERTPDEIVKLIASQRAPKRSGLTTRQVDRIIHAAAREIAKEIPEEDDDQRS